MSWGVTLLERRMKPHPNALLPCRECLSSIGYRTCGDVCSDCLVFDSRKVGGDVCCRNVGALRCSRLNSGIKASARQCQSCRIFAGNVAGAIVPATRWDGATKLIVVFADEEAWRESAAVVRVGDPSIWWGSEIGWWHEWISFPARLRNETALRQEVTLFIHDGYRTLFLICQGWL